MKFTKAEIDAIIEASPRTFVPFNKLVLSQDYQARAGGSTPKMSIAELAASIKESGVLQNLVVVQGARGRYEVCAGGRRLEALTLLVGNGDLADNYPVPVLIVPADKALIASLSENCFHIPMHPADEFAAFAKLIGQGKSVEDVAAAFGITPLVVKRRMKLATVSPKLMALFREDQIGLDCLMVLASVDDHQKQEQTWAALPSWNRRPDYLRQLLTQGEIESDRDAVAKYVTLKAYEKAGGALRRDLFSDDDKKAYLLDAALLEKLATDKLQKRAKQIAGRRLEMGRCPSPLCLRRVRQVRRTAQDEAPTGCRGSSRPGGPGWSHRGAARADGKAGRRRRRRGDLLSARRRSRRPGGTTQGARRSPQRVAGRPDGPGRLRRPCRQQRYRAVKYGLIRPEDRSDMVQAARQAAENGTDEPLVSLPSPKTRPVHSEKLVRCLTAHRVAAVQAELLDRPDVALAAITAHLAQKIFRGNDLYYCRSENVFAISATDSQSELRSAAEDMVASTAWAKLQAERTAWAERLPENLEDIFPWLLAQEQATVLHLLTFVVAVTVTGIYGTEPERQSNEALARALGLDMSQWWTATGASYFNHVSKARVLEVVTEAVDANAASPLAALKKDAVVTGAEQTVAGTGWLPACLRINTAQTKQTEAAADDTCRVPAEPALTA
jgi:ParB family chromosome partitioning protein